MSADDFSDLIDEFGNAVDQPWARHNGQTFDGGLPIDGGWTTGTIPVAAIFPLQPNELDQRPEGGRKRGSLVAYVRVDVLEGVITAEGSQRRGDITEYQGGVWQVVDVNDWGPSGNFLEVRFDRIDTTLGSLAAYIAAEAP